MTAPARQLGLQIVSGPGASTSPAPARVASRATNTRHSLWPERWPAIALDSCVAEVEAAPADEQAQVKWNLPCHSCDEQARCLNGKFKEVGGLLYDRELQTTPRSSESTFFPRELMEPMLNPGLVFQRHYWKPEWEPEHWAVAQAWDLAWSEKTGGDYLVCMTAVVHRPTGKRRLLSLERWQRISFPDQCELIQQRWRSYQADVVAIETDAAQAIWAQHLSRTSPVPVVRHTAGAKTDLATGVPSLLMEFEAQKWEFPYMPGSWLVEEVDTLLAELEAFGWVDGKLQGVGEHDDTVMCLWHLAWIIKRLLLGGQDEQHVNRVAGRMP